MGGSLQYFEGCAGLFQRTCDIPLLIVLIGHVTKSQQPGGLFDGGAGVERSFLDEVGPALYVPGCPPHPLTFVNAILDFIGAA